MEKRPRLLSLSYQKHGFLLFLGLVIALCVHGYADTSANYGVLQATLAHAVSGTGIGCNVALVSVNWSSFEPSNGTFSPSYISSILSTKASLRNLGYKLQLDFGIQYPPSWVFTGTNTSYVDQYGHAYSASAGSGADLPNVVFNNQVRTEIATYVQNVFSSLGTDWDYVRLGWGCYGELTYPSQAFNSDTNSYWGFDNIAQGKASGLPSGVSVCPVPGWLPGQGSSGHANASAFLGWYLNSIQNYQSWQISTVRQWYGGNLCMLYGGWGIRTGGTAAAINDDLDNASGQEQTGEIQQGHNWIPIVASLTDPKAIVYCTWMDGTLNNQDICNDNTSNQMSWSPVHFQSSLAQSNPLNLPVWGENTGGNNLSAMQLTFTRMRTYNVMGIMWAFDSQLWASPNPNGYAAFTDYANCIAGQLPAVPAGLAATSGNSQISLNWSTSYGAATYNVKRSTRSGGAAATIASPASNSYTDTSVSGTSVYYYTVSAVDAAGETANSSQVTATVTLTSLQQWRLQNFGSLNPQDPVAGDTADPAGTGVPNLTRYALGLAPSGAVTAGLPAANDAGACLSLSFTRCKADTDITYNVEASSDLASWSEIWSSASTPYGGGTNPTQQVIVSDTVPMSTAPGGRRFLHLKVTDP